VLQHDFFSRQWSVPRGTAGKEMVPEWSVPRGTAGKEMVPGESGMCGCTDAYLHVVSCGEDARSRTTGRINGRSIRKNGTPLVSYVCCKCRYY